MELSVKNKFLDNLFSSFSVELPELPNMDAYLDFIIPQVRPWGEDLYEQEYYLDTRWLEIRDKESFHESVLHIFRDKGEYLVSVDGNISNGKWRVLEKSNTLILDLGNRSELFDLAFLNNDFFILRKHGDQARKGNKKYFVMGRENFVQGYEWREIMELLFSRYRSNSQFIILVTVVILIVIIIAGLSIF